MNIRWGYGYGSGEIGTFNNSTYYNACYGGTGKYVIEVKLNNYYKALDNADWSPHLTYCSGGRS